jgi:hypothetical protein
MRASVATKRAASLGTRKSMSLISFAIRENMVRAGVPLVSPSGCIVHTTAVLLRRLNHRIEFLGLRVFACEVIYLPLPCIGTLWMGAG